MSLALLDRQPRQKRRLHPGRKHDRVAIQFGPSPSRTAPLPASTTSLMLQQHSAASYRLLRKYAAAAGGSSTTSSGTSNPPASPERRFGSSSASSLAFRTKERTPRSIACLLRMDLRQLLLIGGDPDRSPRLIFRRSRQFRSQLPPQRSGVAGERELRRRIVQDDDMPMPAAVVALLGSSRSIIATRKPANANSRAQAHPTIPAPIMMTS